MAAYSQYGSAFLLVGMFLVMSITFFKDKKLSEIKKMFILTIVVIIVGVVPLIYFFMYKQVSDSLTIAHIPFFAYGNVFRDFLISVVKQIAWCFTRGAVHDQLSIAILIVAFGAVILTLIALFHKNKLLNNIVSVYLISFILYYFATACNYYGWNSWTSTVGTKNIGGRYSLFFVPLIMILLTYGIFIIITYLKENNIHGYYFLIAIVSLSFVGYSIAGIWILHKNWIKDDVRELTKVWYADNAYNSKTIVHEWDDANFQYYLIHDYQYKENYQNNIQAAGYWIRSANDQKMEDGLQELGAFDYDDFYYVAPKENYNSSYKSFLNVMYNRGYLVTILFEGRSVLLHVTASN